MEAVAQLIADGKLLAAAEESVGALH
jgi:hypothetical protein